MATIYAANRNSSSVALKVLSGQAAGQFHIRQLFLREYRLVSHLRHPNIIHMHDVGEFNGRFYIAMDLVPGETLEELLARRKTLGEAPAMAIIRQIAEALDYIHGEGIVHRDIKPGNIMVSPNGRAVLFDFGAALDINNPDDSDSKGIFGTPSFIAPEQIRNERLDGRADLYALGIVGYLMLSGRRPFYGARSEILDAHQHVEPLPPSQHSYVSPGIERIILKLLAKNPDDRYTTGAALIEALDNVDIVPEPQRPELGQRVMNWFRNRP